jgi:hypothetical protein
LLYMGMNQRQIEGLINNLLSSMKIELNREYANILYRQGRAKGDCANFNPVEMDTVAMCEAYSTLFARAVAGAIEANNKKLVEDIKKQLESSSEKELQE